MLANRFTLDNIITGKKFLDLSDNIFIRSLFSNKINENNIVLTPERNVFFLNDSLRKEFVKYILPNIKYSFILISHYGEPDYDTDYTDPTNEILDNPFLIKWFKPVCDIEHLKVFFIPFGLCFEDYNSNRLPLITPFLKTKFFPKKEKLVYSNFSTGTNREVREKIIDIIQNKPFIVKENNLDLDVKIFYSTLRNFKYTISPPGRSQDAFRTFEALYLNTIPICIKHNNMQNSYGNDLPILFVDDWSQITEELLEESYSSLYKKSIKKAKFQYYRDIILEYKGKL